LSPAKGLAQNAFTYYNAHRRLSKAQMEKVDADVMQNRVIIKNRYSVNRYWHGTSIKIQAVSGTGSTPPAGRAITALKKTILEKK
jgi:hypothetical protein